jgi:hypothetical protein
MKGDSDVIQTHGLFQQAAEAGHVKHRQQGRKGQLKKGFLGITIHTHLSIVGNSLMIMVSIRLFRINASLPFELPK